MPAIDTMNGSRRLIVPLAPITYSRRPVQAICPARVTTKDGIRKRVIQKPWNRPISVPPAIASRTATTPGTPYLTLSTAMKAAVSPLTTPTVRSISPSRRTNTTPMAIVPTAAICMPRLTRLNDRKNLPFDVT